MAQGLPFVFTDGHAVIDFTKFYEDAADLNRVDWEIMEAVIWRDIPSDGDRKRRRQAEFLVYDACPMGLIDLIAVKTNTMARHVTAILEDTGYNIPIEVRSDWYY
jgi:hypothetical protein